MTKISNDLKLGRLLFSFDRLFFTDAICSSAVKCVFLRCCKFNKSWVENNLSKLIQVLLGLRWFVIDKPLIWMMPKIRRYMAKFEGWFNPRWNWCLSPNQMLRCVLLWQSHTKWALAGEGRDWHFLWPWISQNFISESNKLTLDGAVYLNALLIQTTDRRQASKYAVDMCVDMGQLPKIHWFIDLKV